MPLIDSFCSKFRDLTNTSSKDLAQIYTADVEFIDPIDHHRGLSEVQAYFAKLTKHAHACEFDIHCVAPCEDNAGDISYVLTWTMTLTLKKGNRVIKTQGTTLLKQNDNGFYYHRDYYDLGEMVYEHIPVLGWVIAKIKRKLRS